MYFIYGIVDPRSGLIGYIGVTSRNPYTRLIEHLHGGRPEGRAKTSWLAGLLADGIVPHIVTLQRVDSITEAHLVERWWIAHGQVVGWPLHNMAHLQTGKHLQEFASVRHREPVEDLVTSSPLTILPNKPPFDISTKSKHDVIWWWRDQYPSGTQAQMRGWLMDLGLSISRGYISDRFKSWSAAREQPTAAQATEKP